MKTRIDCLEPESINPMTILYLPPEDTKGPCKPKRRSNLNWLAIAIGIAVASMVASQSKSEPVAYPSAESARFTVEVTGSGPDVILIPGLGCSRDVWNDTVAHFKGQYRLHVLNIAGFAGTPAGANAKGDILPAIVESLDAYIKANHLKSPVIVGHSLGGLLAMMEAKAYPEDVSKAVIVDAFPYIGVLFDPSATPDKLKPQVLAMKAGIDSMPAEAFAATQAKSTAGMVSNAMDQKTVSGWTVASDRHVFAEAFFEDMMTDMRSDLGAIKTPFVVIAPHDDASPYSFDQTNGFYAMLYQAHPNTKVIGIDHAKHFVMLDQKEAFLKALDESMK